MVNQTLLSKIQYVAFLNKDRELISFRTVQEMKDDDLIYMIVKCIPCETYKLKSDHFAILRVSEAKIYIGLGVTEYTSTQGKQIGYVDDLKFIKDSKKATSIKKRIGWVQKQYGFVIQVATIVIIRYRSSQIG